MGIKTKVEYIWLDGTKPEQKLRSKTKIVDLDTTIVVPKPGDLPEWSFDGSSTNQADGDSSDCLLRPVSVYVEQEYVLLKDGKPLGFPKEGYPEPQGKYYCGVGSDRVKGREIAEQHLDACLTSGLDITGINAEVMLGQWEYQLLGKGAMETSDDLWISRYLLYRITESHGVEVELHPKPVKGEWNGSGMHVNFSTKEMRENGGKDLIMGICDTLSFYHEEHINNYGSDNDQRLTGKHETQKINTFTYGVSDRGASIRIPISTVKNDWKGYLEDRRPASNACPYKITKIILETLKKVD